MKLKKKSLKESNKCCPELFIVDDDEVNILALSMMLKNLGVKFNSALNGKLAIKMIME